MSDRNLLGTTLFRERSAVLLFFFFFFLYLDLVDGGGRESMNGIHVLE